MDLAAYRNSKTEQKRLESLLALIPESGGNALDVGARDGFLSVMLATRFASVTALDLTAPLIDHPSVTCVKGDVRSLQYADDSFDLVLCTEVLEHIPVALLPAACAELIRVSRRYVVIGVPHRQDIRVGRMTCGQCGRANPPWGHVNRFDEQRLIQLFCPVLSLERSDRVGGDTPVTNAWASTLLDYAGNPYGTYWQAEPCVHCGARLRPPRRSILQKLVARAVYRFTGRTLRDTVFPPLGWLHARFHKERAHDGLATEP